MLSGSYRPRPVQVREAKVSSGSNVSIMVVSSKFIGRIHSMFGDHLFIQTKIRSVPWKEKVGRMCAVSWSTWIWNAFNAIPIGRRDSMYTCKHLLVNEMVKIRKETTHLQAGNMIESRSGPLVAYESMRVGRHSTGQAAVVRVRESPILAVWIVPQVQ